MAKGRAKLRVIAGGAGGKLGKAVVTTTARPPSPKRVPKSAALPVSKRVVEPEPDVEDPVEGLEEPVAPKNEFTYPGLAFGESREFPRTLLFAALAIAIAIALYLFVRRGR